MRVRKITPVAIVDRVEPSLGFWAGRLGFESVAEVPEGDAIGFALLVKDGVEVMLQSRASVERDVPALAAPASGPTVGLYVEVDDLQPVLRAIEGCEVVVPERTTFYGKREIGVREPGGHVVTFAADIGEGAR